MDKKRNEAKDFLLVSETDASHFHFESCAKFGFFFTARGFVVLFFCESCNYSRTDVAHESGHMQFEKARPGDDTNSGRGP